VISAPVSRGQRQVEAEGPAQQIHDHLGGVADEVDERLVLEPWHGRPV